MFENHERKALDGGLGHIQLDAAFEGGNCTNRDRDIPATPQMALLEEDMGDLMRQTFDDQVLHHSDLAIGRMDAIASMNANLTQGERVMANSAGLFAAVTAANPSP